MNKREIIERVSSAGRKMSTAEIIFHQALAQKAGLSGADHKYLDILYQEGSMTAGKLAKLTGLTTGAVTGLINRLEKSNLVKREKDLSDKRKVLVVLQKDNALNILMPIFTELMPDLYQFYSKYTLDELKIIEKYLKESALFYNSLLHKLRNK